MLINKQDKPLKIAIKTFGWSNISNAILACQAFTEGVLRGAVKTFILASLIVFFLFKSFKVWAAEDTFLDKSKLLSTEQFKQNLPENNEELDLEQFLEMRKREPLLVLDVRSKKSFKKRHLKGSVNIPLTDLTEKTLRIIAPDKNTAIVLACDYSFAPRRMVAMTIQAYPVLKANGYKNIHRLNLWERGDGMLSAEEQEKIFQFEGIDRL